MTAERTLVLLKPDALERNLRGEILNRIERKGYTIVAMEQREATSDELSAHYAEHADKPFFPSLVDYMSAGSVVAIVLEGTNVIAGFRSLAGATNPTQAAPGTIRGDLGREWEDGTVRNLVHGSDAPESAAREIAIWFPALG